MKVGRLEGTGNDVDVAHLCFKLSTNATKLSAESHSCANRIQTSIPRLLTLERAFTNVLGINMRNPWKVLQIIAMEATEDNQHSCSKLHYEAKFCSEVLKRKHKKPFDAYQTSLRL